MTTQYPSNPFGQPIPVSPAPKPSGRWKWIAGIVAAFVLGLTFGSLGNSGTSSAARCGRKIKAEVWTDREMTPQQAKHKRGWW